MNMNLKRKEGIRKLLVVMIIIGALFLLAKGLFGVKVYRVQGLEPPIRLVYQWCMNQGPEVSDINGLEKIIYSMYGAPCDEEEIFRTTIDGKTATVRETMSYTIYSLGKDSGLDGYLISCTGRGVRSVQLEGESEPYNTVRLAFTCYGLIPAEETSGTVRVLKDTFQVVLGDMEEYDALERLLRN